MFVHETDNIDGDYPEGARPLAYSTGSHALFQPPRPGNHVLELGGRVCDDTGATDFEVAVTYNLHVH